MNARFAFGGQSIRSRVIWVIMATVSATLFAGYVTLLVYDRRESRTALVSEAETLCGILADRTAYALAFRDADAARSDLAVLASHPSVRAAAIFDDKGQVFASYARRGHSVNFPAPTSWPARSFFREDALLTLTTIEASGQTVGYAVLRIGQEALHERARVLTLIVVTLLVASLLMALAVSASLQRIITAPVQHLVGVAQRISRLDASSGERANTSGVAELDVLAEAFNVMLARIEHRDEVLREANHALEARVAQRTEELVLAKNEAERASRAKSAFLSNMSHELRTPLNAVLGFSRLLRDAPDLSSRQAESLDIITRSGERLLAMINDVLEIARIEAGRLTLEETTFDLHQAMHDTKAMIYVKAAQKGLALSVELAADVPRFVRADAHKLTQTLLNLADNAVKYTENGRVVLGVSVARWLTFEQAQLRFEVTDTGHGMGERELERIFFPFVRLAEHEATGTGLGLALSKEFVELMGGKLTVESALGSGSKLQFEIRVNVPSAPGAAEAPPRRRLQGLAQGEPAYRILIAEDQADARSLLRRLLEPLRVPVCEVGSGEEVLRAVREFKPDLIFMDIRMPVMDGVEATRMVRSHESGREIKIVALTAHALEEEKRQILAAGFDEFIRKPYTEQDIFDALAKHLGARLVFSADVDGGKHGATSVVRPEALERLPAEVFRELLSATELLDRAATLLVVDRVSLLDRELGACLRELVVAFRYGELLAALDSVKPSASERSLS